MIDFCLVILWFVAFGEVRKVGRDYTLKNIDPKNGIKSGEVNKGLCAQKKEPLFMKFQAQIQTIYWCIVQGSPEKERHFPLACDLVLKYFIFSVIKAGERNTSLWLQISVTNEN